MAVCDRWLGTVRNYVTTTIINKTHNQGGGGGEGEGGGWEK